MHNKHKGSLRNLDPSWVLEEAMISLLAGKAAEKRTLQQILTVMPTAAVFKEISVVVAEVATIKHSATMTYAPAAVKNTVGVIHDMLVMLSNSQCPCLELASSTPFARSVFFRFVFPSSEGCF